MKHSLNEIMNGGRIGNCGASSKAVMNGTNCRPARSNSVCAGCLLFKHPREVVANLP